MKTNKFIAGVLSLCLMGGMLPFTENTFPFFSASASSEEYTEEIYDGYLAYAKYNDHIEIIDCENEAEGELVIPAEIEGLPVTVIGEYAFVNCYGLKSITIPGSVKSIGECAFEKCIRLTAITISDGVKSIEKRAFHNCGSLTEIIIPDSVESIGFGAFAYCDGLTSIKIENPECEIYDDEYTICNGSEVDHICYYYNGTIYGYENSTAQAYAERYNRKFVAFEEMPKGDVDGDGKIDATDASKVLAEYALTATGHESTFTEKQKLFADVNSDSKVDSSDASSILAYYAYKATGGDKTLEEFLKK